MNATETERTEPLRTIAICGAGLAGRMTAAALTRALPQSIGITLVDCDADEADLFYGNVTSPTAYDFNFSAGVTEPRLVLDSDTAFSWGTKYENWGEANRSWIQCFHLALPIVGGVMFHHYLLRRNLTDLQPFLIPAVAARLGAFAHPPNKGAQPLSRAEYGYQFDPRTYAGLFAAAAEGARLHTIKATIANVDVEGGEISAIQFTDGRALQADLFVDCTGPEPALLSRLNPKFMGGRRLRAVQSFDRADRLGPPIRTLVAHDFGWRSHAPIRGALARLSVLDPDAPDAVLDQHANANHCTATMTLGRFEQAWLGNCIAIGHAAGVIEPLTPAPMILLQRDIERLLSLVPSARDMSIERREFNRHFVSDFDLAELFNRTFFETDGLPETPYWRAARAAPLDGRLASKIQQFESRGVLVAFDLEPFNLEDWTILHFGMGRRPARYDRLADKADEGQIRRYLEDMKTGIEKMAAAMPDHQTYMARLRQFLMTQQG